MGYGRHAAVMSVGMTYANLNNSYVAKDCYMRKNGSTVTCNAVAGVGKRHRWTMNWNGYTGYQSPADVYTNYKPPVLYDIFSQFNKTKTSDTAGGDVFNVTGDNFGPISENAVWWVRYSPQRNPAVRFDANCSLIEDHHVLTCTTGPQAGMDFRWVINVAGQVSVVPSTTTQVPQVSRVVVLRAGTGLITAADGSMVGDVPIRAAGHVFDADTTGAGLGAATSGGGMVIIYGRYCPFTLPFKTLHCLCCCPAALLPPYSSALCCEGFPGLF
jgi:hypothetical protein